MGLLARSFRPAVLAWAVLGCTRTHARDLSGDVPVRTAVPIHGVVRSAGFGTALSCDGDLTGDGIPDLVVGAPRVGDGADGAGAVYVFAGPIEGPVELAEAVAVLLGETAEDQAGISVASGGDLDGDGEADLVIGSWAAGGEERGGVYVVFGPIAGERSLTSADVRLYGTEPSDHGGFAVTVADLDADGIGDLATSSFHADRGGTISIFFGPVLRGARPLSAAETTIVATTPDEHVGLALASGDLTGDGIDDLAIGAPLDGPGRVHVVSLPGRGRWPVSEAVAHLAGAGFEEAGSSVAVSDVTGDGIEDLIVGAPGAEAEAGTVGGAYVVPGPIAGEAALAAYPAIFGERPIDGFGVAVAAGFDRDGDGVGDFLAGAWGLDAAIEGEGAAYFFYGPPRGGLGRDLGARLVGEREGGRAGMAVAGCEGWGRATIVVGAPGTNLGAGSVYVFP